MSDFFLTVKPYLNHYGYWALFGALLVESFGMPLPGETLLIASALLASHGEMHIVPVLLIACAAAVTGDNIGYAIGHFGGRKLVLRYGHYVLISEQRLQKAERFFGKYGGAVVVIARFLAVLRQLNGIVAGTVKMSWHRFLAYNILGAALWVGFWGMLFYELGERAFGLGAGFKTLQFFFLGGLVAATAALAIHLRRRRRG
ncbi:MAG: DedA family protein [Deltaproteobacteria bacterium]|nr:DedA family protein [Deltaproteobacteria bacterium]